MSGIFVNISQSEIAKAVASISKYASGVQERTLREINKTAFKVEAAAKKNFASNVPFDVVALTGALKPHVRHGRLRASINIDPATPLDMEAVVKSGTEYDEFVEFGTSRSRPHPFMFPAAEENRRDHAKRMREALKP